MERTMAEAAVETPAVRFFCHKCNQEINPVLPVSMLDLLDYRFTVEDSDDDLDHAAQFRELWNNTIMDVLRRLDRAPGEDGGVQLVHDAPSSSASDVLLRQRGPPSRTAARAGRRPHPDNQARQPLEGIIHQIFANLTGAGGKSSSRSLKLARFVNLHGNPGDYAWGRGGLDAVITQLLNQLDGTGPPPLPKEKIDQIPTVKIVQEQVDKSLQCTVCMEEFRVGDQVKRLTCLHHFHPDCIVPWLELHGTCPICRKLLSDEANAEDPTSPGVSHRSPQGGPQSPGSRSDRGNTDPLAAFLRMRGAATGGLRNQPGASRTSGRQPHQPHQPHQPPHQHQNQQPQSQPQQGPSNRGGTRRPSLSGAAASSSPTTPTSRHTGHPGNQYSVYDFNDECD
ncbi:unnamed protein product [Ixodes hexagonus]